VVNGPNINLTGTRQPEVYGSVTFADMLTAIDDYAKSIGAHIIHFQSNHEGEIISFIHKCHFDGIRGIVINPGAYSHYSLAIADALRAVAPSTVAVEVHLSNIHAREEARHKSVTVAACVGMISGFGVSSYLLAINYIYNLGG